MPDLTHYIRLFKSLRVARKKGMPAPHKPILLLAVIQGFESRLIWRNRIYISPELLASFIDIWKQLNYSEIFKPHIYLPFFHLHTSGFWFLKLKLNSTIPLTSSNSISSFSALRNSVDYATLSDDLFQIFCDPIRRE